MPRTSESKNIEALKIDEALTHTFTQSLIPTEPPDISEFAQGEFFCHKKLYPRQLTILKLIYADVEHFTDYDYTVIDKWRNGFYFGDERIGVSPDIFERIKWLRDNGRPHFREIEFIGGRRGGKGHLGGILGAYQSYKMICRKSPQRHYGIDPAKDLYCFVTATNLQQAEGQQFKDIAETISSSRCFEKHIATNKNRWLSLRTDADKLRIAEYARRNVSVEREIATIKIMAQSSNSRAGRGAATFQLFFDEMAHMLTGTEGPQTAEEVYKALTPSLDQCRPDQMIYIPTSPYTKVGAAFDIYQDGLRMSDDGAPENPDVFVIQLPSWDPYEDWEDPHIWSMYNNGKPYLPPPQLFDDAAQRLEKRDPESFKVERRAQWAEVINAYLNPKIVDRMFDPIQVAGMPRVLYNHTPGLNRWVYRGHADPSDSQANFAVAIGHTEPVNEVDEESGEIMTMSHVFFDWLHVFKPEDYEDHQVDYMEVNDEIVEILLQFPSLKDFSYDQYGGYIAVPLLKTELRKRRHHSRVHEATFTEKSNRIRAERFKSAIGMGWVHSPRDQLGNDNNCLLEQELKFLQVKSGRIIKQTIGPVTTKDLADCVMEVSSELLKDQIDRLERGRALSGTRLAVGAQGGYHSGAELPPTPGTARDRLGKYGGDRLKRKQYGV